MNKPPDENLRSLATRARQPVRIEPLAVLPLFWKLEGQSALVLGTTDAAAWKAELLAAAGARVTIIGASPGQALKQLLVQDTVNGTICAQFRAWTAEDLKQQSLVIADSDDPVEIDRLIRAARREAVPYNVIDKPGFCQFQFGSIVNRSPVVIGISTNGAAPILGQNIRRRIEAVVPRSLKRWAEFAAAIRLGVNKHLAPGVQRRHFWEELSKHAFTVQLDRPYRKATRARLAKVVQEGSRNKRLVTTIKLNSNDPEDLTLRQLRLLQSASHIAYDPAVDAQILEMARREAIREPLGKKISDAVDLLIVKSPSVTGV